jgi:hypothetical protein
MARNDRELAYKAEIAKIEKRDGQVTPAAVVKAASDPKNPLHSDPRFHWGDDATAAYERRLDVAREIIVSVKVMFEIEERTIRVPMYVRDPNAGPTEQGYVNMIGVSRSKSTTAEVLEHEAECAMQHLRRYRDLVMSLKGSKEIVKFIDGFERLHAKLLVAA